MPKMVSLRDIQGIPDPVSKDNFNFIIGNTPGGSNDKNLHIKCQSVQFPALANEAMTINMFGHRRRIRGKIDMPTEVTATYIEDKLFKTSLALRNWHNTVVDPITGSSRYTSDGFSTISELTIYDARGNAAYSVGFVNMFPLRVDGFEVGEGSGPIVIQATFAFDYFIEAGSGGGLGGLISKALGFNTISNVGGTIVNSAIDSLGLSGNVLGMDYNLNSNGLQLTGPGDIGLNLSGTGVQLDTAALFNKGVSAATALLNGGSIQSVFGGGAVGGSQGGSPLGSGTLGGDSAAVNGVGGGGGAP